MLIEWQKLEQEGKRKMDNNNKRGRGRPSGSPNKNTTLKRLSNNRDLVKKEVAKKAGLFVVKQMNNLD